MSSIEEAALWLTEKHKGFFSLNGERYYNTNGVQCSSKCLVGELPLLCICELTARHEGECERTPTMRRPSVEQIGKLKWHDEFAE